jgi:voltage-gated potassium channel Kch
VPIYQVVEPGLGRQRLLEWRRRLRRSLALFGLVLLGTGAGLALLDRSGAPFLDRALVGLWNAANLITTLGDFTDFDGRQRLFIVVTMFVTLGLGAFALSELSGLLSTEAVLAHRENRVMERTLEALSGHVVVIGFRTVGELVAERLREEGETLVIVDRDRAQAERASQLGHLVVQGDAGVDEHVFERARVATARSVVVTTGDPDRNLVITLMAHAANPHLKIAVPGQSAARAALLHRAGATEVVVADDVVAQALLDRIHREREHERGGAARADPARAAPTPGAGGAR